MNQLTENQYWLDVTKDADYKAKYFDDPSISTAETVDAIVKSFPENPKSITEIGCGYGRLTVEVKKRYPDAFVSGTDINPEILKEAEAFSGWREDKENTTKYPFYYCRDNLLGIGLQDAIYAVTVFQHLPNEKKLEYIRQAARALKKGGVLRIQYIDGVRDNFVDHWVLGETMKLWFEECGLSEVQIEKGLVHEQWDWITGKKS